MEENLKNDTKEKRESINFKRHFYEFFVEIYTWFGVGLVLSLSIWGLDFNNSSTRIKIMVFSLGFLLFPIMFKLIFSKLPIEYIRSKFSNNLGMPNIVIRTITDSNFNMSSEIFLAYNVQECKMNSERLFSQSRIYLLLGCLIAIGGVLVFFYLGNNSILDNYLNEKLSSNENISSILSIKFLEHLPRFGILFFIEYIAFFFLKQYRILMEEYRYYESIKRQRQDVLSVYLLIKEYNDNQEILNIIVNYIDKHSVNVPIITGSDRIKTEKIVNDDFDIISKITSMIQTIKSSNK